MKLAIIGGSILPALEMQNSVLVPNNKTPYGDTSAKFISGKIADMNCVYINRHGEQHQLAPHEINYRANIWLAKQLGVTDIISLSAVGGITKKMAPMTCVLPEQLIDYSYAREHTYQQNGSAVKHIDFSYPFDSFLINSLKKSLQKQAYPFEKKSVYGVTQGPRLETIAEIKRMEQDGCDIVGMTLMPEVALARELDINYATLSIVVNWAAGKDKVNAIISMDEINKRIEQSNNMAQKIILDAVDYLISTTSLAID